MLEGRYGTQIAHIGRKRSTRRFLTRRGFDVWFADAVLSLAKLHGFYEVPVELQGSRIAIMHVAWEGLLFGRGEYTIGLMD